MRLAASVLFACVCLPGQTFEVASIKPSGPKSVRGSDGGPGSARYTFGQATVLDLILAGYNVDPFQVSSKAALDQNRFDLAAALPPGTTRDQFRAMIRNLLADRFHLQAHVESREFPAYELVVAKGGAKLKETKGEGKPGMTSENTMSNGYLVVKTRANQMPISVLTRMLRVGNDVPVVDRTGLNGKYDFTLDYAREMRTPTAEDPAPPAPILHTAIQQQLGLQLVSRKLPFDVVVVDAVDKLPTEN